MNREASLLRESKVVVGLSNRGLEEGEKYVTCAVKRIATNLTERKVGREACQMELLNGLLP